MKYALVIRPLDEADGGGYLGFFPDLPGCMSDGESPQEALLHALDALEAWTDAQAERGAEMPEPDSAQVEAQAHIESLTSEIDRLTAELARLRQKPVQALIDLPTRGLRAGMKPFKQTG